ncbi:hypothetical protein [Paracoccus sp. KR1-242]|uniref:hypothetical protein n=1 Tax=Paracoccus sp. KR1-242 TaxID=3410028 RepID=UPI003C1142A8
MTDPRSIEDLRAELVTVADIADELERHFALAHLSQRHGIRLDVLRRALPTPDPARDPAPVPKKGRKR